MSTSPEPRPYSRMIEDGMTRISIVYGSGLTLFHRPLTVGWLFRCPVVNGGMMATGLVYPQLCVVKWSHLDLRRLQTGGGNEKLIQTWRESRDIFRR
jgi:hypothetical protein